MKKLLLFFSVLMLLSASELKAQVWVGESTVTMSVKLKSEARPFSSVVKELPESTKIGLFNSFDGNYILVVHESDTGYVNKKFISDKGLVNKVLYGDKDPRLARLQRRFGQQYGKWIFERKAWVGMTEEMVRASWGSPSSINRTITAYGVSEQWVYGTFPHTDKYVYLEDGKVTVIQD